jgi:HD-GYP domain-containing protein (c-di-GMP phosphodiesterase class II)
MKDNKKMDNGFFLSLFNRFGLHYGFVNSSMIIHFDNDDACKYLSLDNSVKNFKLEDVFNEIIGLENEIRMVLSGDKDELCITVINRLEETGKIFNLYFIHHPYEDYQAVAVIRDMTDEALSRQSYQQSANEIDLLQHELIDKNRDLDMTNRELRESRDEMKILNYELEETVELRTLQFKEKSELSQRLFLQTVNSLMYALEMRDPYTAGHQQRVSMLATAIAKKMDFDEFTVEGIMIAGKVHDLGKIYVPSEFLTKPGKLPEEAMMVIRTHPRIGFEILKDIEFPWPIASIVLQHHERIDGSGYPYGLEGDEISIEAKILCVADVVEAMITNRPYRISPGVEEALQEIQKYRGIKYECSIVDACISLFLEDDFDWE